MPLFIAFYALRARLNVHFIFLLCLVVMNIILSASTSLAMNVDILKAKSG